ncbi:MAG TPA: hypothetical protein VFL57_10525, partial [Bryobacteraceae bacterium]|nr:hypothetical protein [Bryobacteraceae bacterium]
ADLYPYLVLTAYFTDPGLYRGRMLEMLRNEVRFTTREDAVPADLDLETGKLGPPSLFGAGEYAKDGLVSITELLGRTPWYVRMIDMIDAAMERAPVHTRYGKLPAADPELNGDFLQVLVRLAAMTGEARYWEWSRRIGDWYVHDVLPANHGLPGERVRLRDHGNEIIAGLVLLYALEQQHATSRAAALRPVIARMLDRVLASANEHGMLYDEIDAATLKPTRATLSDNWGYVYAAMYAFYQATGDEKYRTAVRRVLANLPHYRNHTWEAMPGSKPGSFDGYADSIESALYLYNREPVAAALAWIESEIGVMASMQQPSGHIENWYGEGNFNRTMLLWALFNSAGVTASDWHPGVRVGAVVAGDRLTFSLEAPANWRGRLRFDYARHHRIFQFAKNYARLNEFPEWFTVDENALYELNQRTYLGSELVSGVRVEPGMYSVEQIRRPFRSP